MKSSGIKRWLVPVLFASVVVLAACVTINVYFPAAEAQEAAAEFVDKVIGPEQAPAEAPNPALEPAPTPKPDTPATPAKAANGARFDLLSLFISSAHAEGVDITIRTPAIQAIQDRMAERFKAELQAHFGGGALGFGNDGLVVVRDAGKISLKDRVAVNQSVADDNRDRKAVYREIAVANNHPEWEPQIRETFAKQWVAGARAGWWYQAGDGSWKQK